MVERQEGQNEAEGPEECRDPAVTVEQPEPVNFREPEVDAREDAKQNSGNDHIVEMGDQKKAVVQLVVERGVGQNHSAETTNGKEDEKSAQVKHRRGKTDPPAPQGRQPIIDFHPRRDGNQQRRDAKSSVHRGRLPHGEEVMQPDHEGNNRNAHRCRNQPGVAVKALPGECGRDFRHHPEGRKDEDVNLRVAEHPKKVDEVHQIPTHVVGEKVEAEVAVEPEHEAAGGEWRHGEDQQDGGAEGRPREQRHPHETHPRRAHLVNGHRKVDPGEGGADSGNPDGQNVIIWSDSGIDQTTGERRIPGPPARRKLPDQQ